MSGFAYRFSVIPAGAIVDARLTARALQVLCLLGRHTNDQGWCRRSQTKMAEELRCVRSTIQDALNLLEEAGWIERRAEGRGRVAAPQPGQPPFAAHSYRVLLDRDDLPAELIDRARIDPEPFSKGVPDQAAPGVPDTPAGGAGPEAAPLEGPLAKEIERERAREDETEGPGLDEFTSKWPSTAIDDETRTTAAWNTLSIVERRAAVAGIEPFLAELKRQGRRYTIAGSKYLSQRKWARVDVAESAGVDELVTFKAWSRNWWASLFARIERGDIAVAKFMVDWAAQRATPCTERRGQLLLSATLRPYPSDGHAMAAWRPWFEAHGVRLPSWGERIWVFLPSEQSPSGRGVQS